jgi:hypothetical protein
MLKIIILSCAICAGGALVWVEAGHETANSQETKTTAVSPISVQDMHANVRLQGLPIQVVEDPF